MTNVFKENKMKKEIAIYVFLVGVLILFTAKLLGIAQLSSIDSRLVSKDDDVRWNAMHALAHLGSEAKETVPAVYPF